MSKSFLASAETAKHAVLAAYHQAVRCRNYALMLKGVAAIESGIPNVRTKQEADYVRKQLDKANKVLRENEAECQGLDLHTINNQLFDSSLRAGLQGDLGAQACFVARGSFGGAEEHLSGALRGRYLYYAPRFMEHGIDVGYWPMVSIALRILSPNIYPLPSSLANLPRPDPYRVYRALRLTYYRSDQAGINPPDGHGASLGEIMRHFAKNHHLSSREMADADRWSQRVYQARYADTPPFNPWQTKDCP